MVVRSTRNNGISPFYKFLRHCPCIFYRLVLALLELLRHCLFECNRLGCDDVHKRATLNSRENHRINLFGILRFTQDQTAARPTKSLVGCCGSKICIGNRAWMCATGNKAGDMGNVCHKVSSHLICNLSESWEVKYPGVCART